jgi:hypothetical protein
VNVQSCIFAKLTRRYLCGLATAGADRVRFFVWRRHAKAIAFGGCVVHGDTRFAEYLGLDYSVAFKLLPYHYVFRELVRWPIASGSGWLQSTSLNAIQSCISDIVSNPLACVSGMCRPSSTCSCEWRCRYLSQPATRRVALVAGQHVIALACSCILLGPAGRNRWLASDKFQYNFPFRRLVFHELKCRRCLLQRKCLVDVDL